MGYSSVDGENALIFSQYLTKAELDDYEALPYEDFFNNPGTIFHKTADYPGFLNSDLKVVYDNY